MLKILNLEVTVYSSATTIPFNRKAKKRVNWLGMTDGTAAIGNSNDEDDRTIISKLKMRLISKLEPFELFLQFIPKKW